MGQWRILYPWCLFTFYTPYTHSCGLPARFSSSWTPSIANDFYGGNQSGRTFFYENQLPPVFNRVPLSQSPSFDFTPSVFPSTGLFSTSFFSSFFFSEWYPHSHSLLFPKRIHAFVTTPGRYSSEEYIRFGLLFRHAQLITYQCFLFRKISHHFFSWKITSLSFYNGFEFLYLE